MYLVDTSIWIALFVEHDSQHLKAVEIIDGLVGKQISLPYIVVAETATVLGRMLGKDGADRFIRLVQESFDITVIMLQNYEEEMTFFRNNRHSISYVDMVQLYLAKKRRLELLTFDRALLKASKKQFK